MIGFLKGRVVSKQPPQLLLDVNGVGYEVEATMTTFYNLPESGSEVTLFTHLAVREDAHTLYGFASQEERRLFRDLIRVNGVGAKMALTILSGTTPGGFIRCVQDSDTRSLTRLPGVGKKTAERLVIEMRDRIGAGDAGGGTPGDAMGTAAGPRDEAFSALVALGYKPQEVTRMLSGVEDETAGSSEEIIRRALKQSAAK